MPWTPWVRLGFDGSSGDTNPNDRHHDTFFQVLPTARTYAAFPFYNAMNNQDLLAELILRPHAKVTVKAEYHYLRLSSRRDLWYAGGGAGNDQIFGYAGVPANGRRDLAQVASLAISAAVLPTVTVAGFYGHAFGGDVIGKSFADRDADYGFVEATFRY